jgi:hypothetical protein
VIREVDMGGADVGGDGSVKWKVWGDNVRPGKEVVAPRGPHGREHQHVDETVDNPGPFRISIELPDNQNDADAFVNALKNLPPAVPGGRVDFTLPIVPDHIDQIRIRWDSNPNAPAHRVHGVMGAMKTAVTKVVASIKSTGAKKKKAPKKTSKRGSKKKKTSKKKR